MGMEGVELVMAAEEEFGITITDDEAAKILTPRDFIDAVAEKVQGRMPRSEVAILIKQIVIETLGIKESEYFEDADFVRDLGIG